LWNLFEFEACFEHFGHERTDQQWYIPPTCLVTLHDGLEAMQTELDNTAAHKNKCGTAVIFDWPGSIKYSHKLQSSLHIIKLKFLEWDLL